MSSSVRDMYHWLSLEPHQRRGLRALQISLGLMLLFRACTELRFAAFLWGPRGIGNGTTSAFLPQPFAAWMDRLYQSELAVIGMLGVLAYGAICLILAHQTRVAALLSLLAVRFFESRLPELGDGGDNVARLVLTYMIFALPAGREARRGSLAVWSHNIAIVAIGLQIGVVYLTSGVLKLTGERWSNGTALYTISQVEWFSHPAFRELFRNPTFTALATYGTVFFQIWFPVAVLTRLKPLWLVFGLFMHVGIATFMGLICFSLAMIGLELFLITDREYGILAAAFRSGKAKARDAWGHLRRWEPARSSARHIWSAARFRGRLDP